RVREAAAEDARHSLLDLFFRRLGIFVEKSLGGENDAIQAIAALRGLLLDERFLDGVRLVDGAQTFEGDDLDALYRFHPRDAKGNRLAFHQDRAGSALSQAAAELRATQTEIVAQHVKQRRCRIDVQAVGLSVYFQRKEAHILMKLLRSGIFVKHKCIRTWHGKFRGPQGRHAPRFPAERKLENLPSSC